MKNNTAKFWYVSKESISQIIFLRRYYPYQVKRVFRSHLLLSRITFSTPDYSYAVFFILTDFFPFVKGDSPLFLFERKSGKKKQKPCRFIAWCVFHVFRMLRCSRAP